MQQRATHNRALIQGLTVHRPWPVAFARGKRIENRDWRLPAKMLNQYIALHSGAGWDSNGAGFIVATTGQPVPPPQECRPFEIFAVARVIACYTEEEQVPPEQRQWFFGDYGFHLADYVEIAPVACKGHQKFWTIPDDVLAQVRAAYRLARAKQQTTSLGGLNA